jgi:hypothetical protein
VVDQPHQTQPVSVRVQTRLEREEAEPVEHGTRAVRNRGEGLARRSFRDLVGIWESPLELVDSHIPAQASQAFNDPRVVEVSPGPLVKAAGDQKV